MDRNAVKEIIYGGVSELLHNKDFYYFSKVGPDYCHFTEQGKEALQEFLGQMAVNILRAEEAALNRRAKDLVIKGLKGEQV